MASRVPAKRCSRCLQVKPLDEFHRRRHYMRNGHRAACKACTRAATRAARSRNPPAIDRRKKLVRSRTHAAIKKGLLKPQRCAGCGSPSAEAHHPRYDLEDAHLQVVWLCKGCHALAHARRPWHRQLDLFAAAPLMLGNDGG